MLRSIFQRILGAFKTNSRRKAPRRTRGSQYPGWGSRRLAVESLESRQLLTVTTLTFGSISDGSFEAPALPTSAYTVAPQSSPWKFSGIAGVSNNNSPFTQGNPNAPSGTQVAFIQDNASISQTVTLDAGVYNLSMFAAQRVNYQSQQQIIEVLIDGADVGLIVPNSPVIVNNISTVTNYAPYQTWNFTVATTGTHSVELLGLSPTSADSTAFIDEVAITPVVDTLLDGGFEGPALNPNAFQTAACGSAWQFSATAGIARNGSDFVTNWTEAQNAPVGVQVGYLQDYGSAVQSAFLDAGTYQLSFLAAQRAIYQTHYQEIEVLVDGAPAGIVDPVNTLYGSYTSSTFTVPTGVHVIEFLGLDPLGGDNTAFIDQVTLTANAINDYSFETPALAPATYAMGSAASSSAWQFSATAGISGNVNPTYTLGNPNAPNGTQVAFIQQTGSMSQSVSLITGSYVVSFLAAQHGNGQTQSQQIEVLLDGTQDIGLITPVGTTYSLYETSTFTVTAGTHTIQFIGLNP